MHRVRRSFRNLSMADSDVSSDVSDGSWEDLSVDLERFTSDSDTSSTDSSEGNNSDKDEIVRGAEPYRFEPLASADEHETDADARGRGDGDDATDPNLHRLQNTDW